MQVWVYIRATLTDGGSGGDALESQGPQVIILREPLEAREIKIRKPGR